MKITRKKWLLILGSMLLILIGGLYLTIYFFSNKGLPNSLKEKVLTAFSSDTIKITANNIKTGYFTNQVKLFDVKIDYKDKMYPTTFEASEINIKFKPSINIFGMKIFKKIEVENCKIINNSNRLLKKGIIIDKLNFNIIFKENFIVIEDIVFKLKGIKVSLLLRLKNFNNINKGFNKNSISEFDIKKYINIITENLTKTYFLNNQEWAKVRGELDLDLSDIHNTIAKIDFDIPTFQYDKIRCDKILGSLEYRNYCIFLNNLKVNFPDSKSVKGNASTNLRTNNTIGDFDVNSSYDTISKFLTDEIKQKIQDSGLIFNNKSIINNKCKFNISKEKERFIYNIDGNINLTNTQYKKHKIKNISGLISLSNNNIECTDLNIALNTIEYFKCEKLHYNFNTQYLSTTFLSKLRVQKYLDYYNKLDNSILKDIHINEDTFIKCGGSFNRKIIESKNIFKVNMEFIVNNLKYRKQSINNISGEILTSSDGIVVMKNIFISINDYESIKLDGVLNSKEKLFQCTIASKFFYDKFIPYITDAIKPYFEKISFGEKSLISTKSTLLYDFNLNKKHHTNIAFSIPDIKYDNHNISLVTGEINLNNDFLSIKNLILKLSEKEYCKLRGSLDFNEKTVTLNFDIALQKNNILNLCNNAKLYQISERITFQKNNIIKASGALYKQKFDDSDILGNITIKTPAFKYNKTKINDMIMIFTINGKTIYCETVKVNFPNKGYCQIKGLLDFKHEVFNTNFELSIPPNIISDLLPKNINDNLKSAFQFKEQSPLYIKGFCETDNISFDNYNLEFLLSHPCIQTGDLIVYDLLTTVQITPKIISAMFSETKGTWNGIDFTQADAILTFNFENKIFHLANLTAKIYDGHLSLDFKNDFNKKKRYLKLSANEINFTPLVKSIGIKNETTKKVGGKFFGYLDSSIVNSSKNKNDILMFGQGKMRIKEADLWTIPVFAKLSEFIGAKWSTDFIGKISKMTIKFDLKGDTLVSDNITTNGNLISLTGNNGKYFINTKEYSCDVDILPLKNIFRGALNILFSPLKWLLKVELQGKGQDVEWRSRNEISKIIGDNKK